jgi:hypothetical protein
MLIDMLLGVTMGGSGAAQMPRRSPRMGTGRMVIQFFAYVME